MTSRCGSLVTLPPPPVPRVTLFIIFTTYFSGLRDDHRRKVVPSDKRRFIEPWWRSLQRLPLLGVVFHNNLSEAFVRNHSTPRIRFERVDAAAHYARGLSLNDLRFFVYVGFGTSRGPMMT